MNSISASVETRLPKAELWLNDPNPEFHAMIEHRDGAQQPGLL